jgi:hypothetical protein
VSVVPNDIFKRPGPHRACAADLDRLAKLRAALDALEAYGVAEPLAALTGASVDQILDGALFDVGAECGVGESFGLATYGPMLDRAGLPLIWGETVFRPRNSLVEPISMFWADRAPYLPQHVAPASEILARLGSLRDPPERAWTQLRKELAEQDRGDATETPAALIARWRLEYIAELDRFCARIAELAEQGASVVTWEDEQGWL